MNCPNCKIEMEDISDNGLSFSCNECYMIIGLCPICKLPMIDPNSEICGHPTCVEKKAENLFG